MMEFAHQDDLFYNLIGAIFSLVGDVPIDSDMAVLTSSISRICRSNLSEMLNCSQKWDCELLTKVRLCAYIYKGECVPL